MSTPPISNNPAVEKDDSHHATSSRHSSHKSTSSRHTRSSDLSSSVQYIETKIRVAREKFRFDEEIRKIELARKVAEAETHSKLEQIKNERELAVTEALSFGFETISNTSSKVTPVDPIDNSFNSTDRTRRTAQWIHSEIGSEPRDLPHENNQGPPPHESSLTAIESHRPTEQANQRPTESEIPSPRSNEQAHTRHNELHFEQPPELSGPTEIPSPRSTEQAHTRHIELPFEQPPELSRTTEIYRNENPTELLPTAPVFQPRFEGPTEQYLTRPKKSPRDTHNEQSSNTPMFQPNHELALRYSPSIPTYGDSRPFESTNQQSNLFNTRPSEHPNDISKRLLASLALPKCEPDVFSGESALFLPWKQAFKTLICEAEATPNQEITYLLKYTSRKPRELVNQFRRRIHPDPQVKLNDLWSASEERFGHTAEVANNLIETLLKAANFRYDDKEALQTFYDTCENLNTQEPYLKGLSILNTSYFMKTLVEKIPKSIKEKWDSKVTKHMVDNRSDDYPPFKSFVKLIHNLSLRQNHPSIAKLPSQESERKGSRYTSSRPDNNLSSKPNPYKHGNPYRHGFKDNKPSTHTTSLKTDVNLEPKLEKSNSQCPIHKTNHHLSECRTFQEKSYDDKLQLLKELKICFRCLEGKHFAIYCTRKDISCPKCNRRHLLVLHKDDRDETKKKELALYSGEAETKDSEEAVKSACTKICGDGTVNMRGKTCGKLILVDIYELSNPERAVRGYVIIDDQSNHSLGSTELFEGLQLYGDEHEFTLETCHGKELCVGRRAENLCVRTIRGDDFPLPSITESSNIPDGTNEIPNPELVRRIPHLQCIADYLPPIDNKAPFLLIIGRDAPELLKVRESINGPIGAAWAQRLDLGWTVSGVLCLDRQGGNVHIIARRTSVGFETKYEPRENSFICKQSPKDDYLSLSFNEFYTSPRDNEIGLSHEDRQFLSLMDKSFHKNQLGNWEAPLPFRNPDVYMPNNRIQAEKRFQSLLRNFNRNPQLETDYFEFMAKLFEKSHASPSTNTVEDGRVWYLPHFGVYHPQKKNQIRVVFDSSAEYKSTSLNSELLTGPDLMNRLIGRLHRFRQEEVAFTCDIEQMFHSFYVNPEHRSYLSFLWFENNDRKKPMIEYQMNVHLYGNGPSPAIATYGLRRAADDVKDKYELAANKFIHEEFYVDDGVYSCSTPQKAIELIKTSQAVLNESNIKLHKVASNSPMVMDALPEEDRAKGLKNLDFSSDILPVQRSLGVQWDLERDELTFQVIDKQNPYTRRGVLSIIHSIYDPLGFLAPYTIVGKRILQSLIELGNEHRGNLAWDDPLPNEFQSEWDIWNRDLSSIGEVRVQRCLKPASFGKVERVEIHGYCDASQDQIGAVVYLRVINSEKSIWVSFLKGCAKVKPLKQVTIPRMELSAAVLLVNTVRDIKRDLEYTVDEEIYYSDSKVVLGYITNQTKRFYIYVANRVHIIRSLTATNQWRYIETKLNPADLVSRGCGIQKLLKSDWLRGPEHLWESLKTPSFEDYTSSLSEEDAEIRSCRTTLEEKTCSFCTLISSHNSWEKLLKAVCCLKLFTRYMNNEKPVVEINPSLIQEAETAVVRHIQQESFPDELKILKHPEKSMKKTELKTLQLRSLDPFIDNRGTLRIGGRLSRANYSNQEKHPWIIPKKSLITPLIIQHYHDVNHHQGRSITHGAVRQAGFWIISGAERVNHLIRNCMRCNFLRRPLESPKMSDLPEQRFENMPPFTNVGMDAFGPWEVMTRKTRGGSANSKRWGIMFTCLVSRAIHIEIVDAMDTSAFINALRRFIAVRGPVALLWSDCGTNFVGARAELREALSEIKDESVKKFLTSKECEWRFNPPHASHFGGVWERQIGTLRRVLEGMLLGIGKQQLTHDLLVTLMAEAAAIVNARPITAISTDPENPEILAPGNLLTLKTRPYLPAPGEFTKPDLYCRTQWRRVQYLVDQFWIRWRREYIQSLQPRRKCQNTTTNIQVNDMVLVNDKDVVRGEWSKGRVTGVKLDPDGVARVADVTIYRDENPFQPHLSGQYKNYKRPICELVFLCRIDNDKL